MKNKVIVLFLLCLVLAFAGNGCIGTQYSKEDEQATEELGKKMMQEWLNENMKGEKVSDKGAVHQCPDRCAGRTQDIGGKRLFVNLLHNIVYIFFHELVSAYKNKL